MKKELKKIHIGCGNKYFKNWVNIDIDENVKADIYDNVLTLDKIENETADCIYACHILEHLGRHEYLDSLNVWVSKLKCGGKLILAVPDFENVCNYFLKTRDIKSVTGLVCGGQKNEYDFHKMIFFFDQLKEDLESIGFRDIKRYDWRDFEMSHIDDYSKAYLPHMDQENGMLMSLNIEATKK